MKVFIILAIVGCVAAMPQAPPSPVQIAAAATKQPDFICKDGGMVPNPTVLQGIIKCKGETTNPKCEYKCVAKVLNLLEPNGLPSRATYARWTKDAFPQSLQDIALDHFKGCFDKFESKLDLNDPTCDAIGAFNDCTWSAQPKLKC